MTDLQTPIISAMYAVEQRLNASPTDAERAELLAASNVLVLTLATIGQIELTNAANDVAAAAAKLQNVINTDSQGPADVYLTNLRDAADQLRKTSQQAQTPGGPPKVNGPGPAADPGPLPPPPLGGAVVNSGIDCAIDCSNLAAEIAAAKKSFVMRYYRTPGPGFPTLTVAEAKALSAAGLKIGVVWEGASDRLTHFSYATGVAEATSAYHQAMVLGQPGKSSIYFAVDLDCNNDGITGPVNDYFRGIADGFATISSGQPAYAIGVYGSGNVCSWLVAHGRAQYTWLAMSTGWGGYKSFTKWNVKQGPNGGDLSFSHDTDVAVADFGGFAL